jgi:hypothetical protein
MPIIPPFFPSEEAGRGEKSGTGTQKTAIGANKLHLGQFLG